MAKKASKKMAVISLVLFVLGAGMAFCGYQMSGSVNAQFSKALTGSYTDQVMMLYICGTVCIAAGGFLFYKK